MIARKTSGLTIPASQLSAGSIVSLTVTATTTTVSSSTTY